VDASGNIYYGDAANKRIMKFDPAGNLITSWGSPGAGDGQFGTIGGVAVDAAGIVFVLDKSNSRVQKFTSDGTFIGKFGSLGRGAGQFLLPEALALDAEGNVYVAEQGTERVQKLTSGGTLIRTLVAPGIYWGPTNPVPLSLAVDRSGFVYVTGGPRLAVIAPSGLVVGTWDSPEARGMVLDDAQNLYVSDYYGNQIAKYGPAPTAVSTSTWGALKSIYR
jgi:DNA-binding beta-propeller fold protein YncE